MIRISAKASKDKAHDILTSILDNFIFGFTTQENKQLLVDHMEWIRRQAGSMDVHCRMETDPAKRLTRIVLDVYSLE